MLGFKEYLITSFDILLTARIKNFFLLYYGKILPIITNTGNGCPPCVTRRKKYSYPGPEKERMDGAYHRETGAGLRRETGDIR